MCAVDGGANAEEGDREEAGAITATCQTSGSWRNENVQLNQSLTAMDNYPMAGFWAALGKQCGVGPACCRKKPAFCRPGTNLAGSRLQM